MSDLEQQELRGGDLPPDWPPLTNLAAWYDFVSSGAGVAALQYLLSSNPTAANSISAYIKAHNNL